MNGEAVLKTNAPELLAVWRYYQWFGSCDKTSFRRVLEEPLQGFVTRVVVDLAHRSVKRAVGAGEDDLTRSQLVQEHPWVSEFVARLGPELQRSINVKLPEHFVDQVFRLFDSDLDGKITKQEWVSKCNILTTEGREQRIAALFTLIDEDSDGFVTEGEVQRVLSDVAQLINEAAPDVLTQVFDVLVDRILHAIYQQLQIPFGRSIPADRMEMFLLSLRKSLPEAWLTSALEGLLKKSELNAADLFRRYSSVVELKSGETQRGITASMFDKVLDDVVDLDAVFRRFDSMLPMVEKTDPVIIDELKVLRGLVNDRVAGQAFSISSLLFRALDLDNSGVIDETELQGFIDLLEHSAKYGDSNKANDLAKSYSATAMVVHNSTMETELQHVMHVLAKNRRVSLERLQGFLNAITGLVKNFALEYVDVHTDKTARDTHLAKIVHVWFGKVSGGKKMNIRSFATVVGNRIVDIFD